MTRLVRLARPGEDPEQTGVAIDPADLGKPSIFDPARTWEALGYRLHSYADTKEPYVAPAKTAAPAGKDAT